MNPFLHPPVLGSLPHFLLWMGDSGLTTLVTGAVVLSLAVTKRMRGLAWLWATAFVLVTSFVLATKLGLFGWGKGIKALDFRGPSGHAALSAFVWPMVAWRLTMHVSQRAREAAFILGSAFAMGIAWVLIAYDFHSLPEVIAGSLLGGGASFACIRAARFAAPPPKPVTVLVGLLIAALIGIQHGKELPELKRFERKMHRIMVL